MGRRYKQASDVAIGYVRVSTLDQNVGPEAQRDAIEKWATANGITVVAWFEDRVSGGTPLVDRPGFMAATSALRTHRAGVLVAHKRDRIARDLVVAGMAEAVIRSAGATLRTVDGASDGDSPEKAMMRGIIDVFAAYERAMIRARTRAALQAKKKRGEVAGTLPFGFRRGGDGRTLVEHEPEQEIIRRSRELRERGLTLNAIVAALRADGVTSPRSNKPLSATQVHRIVKQAA